MTSHNEISGPQPLTLDDIAALQHMLDHKLHDVPNHRKLCMYTIDEILDGTQDLSRPYVT